MREHESHFVPAGIHSVNSTPECIHRVIEIVKRSDSHKFVVLPKRWIVERTFAWLAKYRRLSKDYETLLGSSESMIRIAMINVMIHKLSPG